VTIVVKIGGGLADTPGALDAVCEAVAAGGHTRPVLVVPGGGPFADTVREFDRRFGLPASSAHAMAILAMDQYAHVLAGRIEHAVRVDDAGAAAEALRAPGVAVLAPSRWLLAADVLPHSWDVTSDSIAAFVAGALDAERLIVVKPASGGPELLDPYFSTACPAGLPVTIVGCDRLDELAAALRG
jgi:aspartokinase-like uncharacterized kinase